MLELTEPPVDFVDNPYPLYQQLVNKYPLLRQSDGSYLVSRYKDVDGIYKNTDLFSSSKAEIFKPKFGHSPLYEHHTTSLVFNDPPLHTRVRKILVGAMTPRAITSMEHGLVALVDRLLDELPAKASRGVKGEACVDVIEHFASKIPIDVIGNLFDMPLDQREPLRDWSLAILGALEPTVSEKALDTGNAAVTDFKRALAELSHDRAKHPGNPDTDVLTRLIQSERGKLTETELLQNCIFILNAGHETTTNLIGNALATLHKHPDQRDRLLSQPGLIATAIDEFLRFESPNQLGNRLTTEDCTINGVNVAKGTNLHLMIGAANRDERAFANPSSLDIARKPNRHLAFAGGPHACLGLNLARMEGRIAIGRFAERYPNYRVVSETYSKRLRFRGFSELQVALT